MSSGRRSVIFSIEDEQRERERNRRSNFEKSIHSRVSLNVSIDGSNLNQSLQPLNDEENRDHWQLCLKLFFENKINTKNAWLLRIVEVTERLIKHQTTDLEALQMGGTSLEVCAKVIGLQVDDVCEQGKVLQANLNRAIASVAAEKPDENLEDAENEDELEKTKGKKTKKKRFCVKQKNCIVKDVNKMLGTLKKLEPVVFSTKINSDTNPIDNLFTNVVKTDVSGINFTLLCDCVPYWSRERELVLTETATFPRPKLTGLENLSFSSNLAHFTVDEERGEDLAEHSATICDLNNVVYDDEGVPVAELDGSILDGFREENDSDEEDDENGIEIIDAQQFSSLMQLQSTANVLQSLNKLVPNRDCGQMILRGPSHWKLKYLKPEKLFFLKEGKDGTKVRKTRAKKVDERVDLDADIDPDELLAPANMKRSGKSKANDLAKDNAEKVQRPLPREINMIREYVQNYKCLMTAPHMVPVPVENFYSHEEEDNYNYENANDSLYCCRNNVSGVLEDDLNGIEEEVAAVAGQMNFEGDNLVEAPQAISVKRVYYELTQKTMNIHKLKVYAWKALTDSGKTTSEEDQTSEEKVFSTTFSELNKKLNKCLPSKMKDELNARLELSFLAVLHLTNENSLNLSSTSNRKDFFIDNLKKM